MKWALRSPPAYRLEKSTGQGRYGGTGKGKRKPRGAWWCHWAEEMQFGLRGWMYDPMLKRRPMQSVRAEMWGEALSCAPQSGKTSRYVGHQAESLEGHCFSSGAGWAPDYGGFAKLTLTIGGIVKGLKARLPERCPPHSMWPDSAWNTASHI